MGLVPLEARLAEAPLRAEVLFGAGGVSRVVSECSDVSSSMLGVSKFPLPPLSFVLRPFASGFCTSAVLSSWRVVDLGIFLATSYSTSIRLRTFSPDWFFTVLSMFRQRL